MKKTSILLLIVAFVFVISGCKQQQAPITQKGNQGVSPLSKTTGTVETVKPVTTKSFEGTYKGTSGTGGCTFAFEVKVADGAVNGTGAGPGKDITCAITLSGKADGQGNMIGQASGGYTVDMDGVKIDFYMSGKFNWKIGQESGDNLTIDLKGTGNTCPPQIPCVNNGDTITATLKKIED